MEITGFWDYGQKLQKGQKVHEVHEVLPATSKS